MDVDKRPFEPAEVEAVTPCAAEDFSGEVVPTAVCVRMKFHICPFLKDWFLDFAGDNRARKQWSMAHSLRVGRRFCPLFENIHDDAPRKWKHSSGASVLETRATTVPYSIPFDKVV